MTQYTPEQARHIAGCMERGAEMRNMGAPALRSLADQVEALTTENASILRASLYSADLATQAMEDVKTLTTERDALLQANLTHITEFGELQGWALSHPKSNLADSGVIAAPVDHVNAAVEMVAGAHPDKGTSALAAPVVPAPVTVNFQQRVQPWMLACFGEVIAADREERNHRFLEEALELVQSTGCTAHEAHQLVDYVYGRPVGESAQEVGGVMVTLAALCLANGLDMHDAAEVELARIWTKVEAIRAKQATKPKHSPLPQAAPVAQLSEPPEGWVLVPIEPTPKMIDATFNHTQERDGLPESHNTRNKRIWRAMLSAAPTTPKE
mgnify:FL=1